MPGPAWNQWSFWSKDPESIRNLAFTIGSIAAIIGGAIGILLATIRSIAAMKQARAATDAQVTKLLIDAIGFLADKEKIELRLGAIYSLERIARKSRTDKERVLEILYAFLRENTTHPPGASIVAPIRTPPDIQACLDVIARNPPPTAIWGKRLTRLTLANIDLRNVDLQGAKLRRVYLSGADLRGANFDKADLRSSNLTKARLQGARLQNCRLNDSDLVEADFEDCQLEGTNLTSAKLAGATFDRAKLQNAILERTDLRRATFVEADLTKASFRGSNLSEAKFRKANLIDTDFRYWRGEGAAASGPATKAVHETILTGADFSETHRTLARFEPETDAVLRSVKSTITRMLQKLRWKRRNAID